MSLLIIIQSPPFAGDASWQAIDLALAAAAFDQQVCVLFRGAGVGHLATLHASALPARDWQATFAQCSLYGLDDIRVAADDWRQLFGDQPLQHASLSLRATTTDEHASLLARARQVWVF